MGRGDGIARAGERKVLAHGGQLLTQNPIHEVQASADGDGRTCALADEFVRGIAGGSGGDGVRAIAQPTFVVGLQDQLRNLARDNETDQSQQAGLEKVHGFGQGTQEIFRVAVLLRPIALFERVRLDRGVFLAARIRRVGGGFLLLRFALHGCLSFGVEKTEGEQFTGVASSGRLARSQMLRVV